MLNLFQHLKNGSRNKFGMTIITNYEFKIGQKKNSFNSQRPQDHKSDADGLGRKNEKSTSLRA